MRSGKHIDIGEQFKNRRLGFLGIDPLLIVHLPEFRPIHQRPLLQFLQLTRQRHIDMMTVGYL